MEEADAAADFDDAYDAFDDESRVYFFTRDKDLSFCDQLRVMLERASVALENKPADPMEQKPGSAKDEGPFKLRLYTVTTPKDGQRAGHYTGYELNGKVYLLQFLGHLGDTIRS